jgi:NAD(P)H-hydrate epimerase
VDGLPDWLEPLPDAQQMRAVDRWAIEQRGVPSLDLMERAGTAVTDAVERIAPDGHVSVVCGKGNNGGDGLVVARLLREAGRPVSVVCLAPPTELRGDAAENLRRLGGEPPLRPDGAPWREGDQPLPDNAEVSVPGAGGDTSAVVDAVLGTGFQGSPHGLAAAAITAINGARAPVASVDVPSGVDASTGVAAQGAVRATVTVTFHAAKPGLWIAPGKTHAGTVETVDIGIPRGAPMTASVGLLADPPAELIPRRHTAATKFTSGQVLVVGGSRGLSGAPTLAARAAMRAGAGYVIACVPASLQDVLAGGGTPEMMTRGLDEDHGAFAEHAVDAALELASRGALALGPGLGRTPAATAFARRLAAEARVPMVLDADGLNAHAGQLESLTERREGTVLTPHAGEMARLLGCDAADVERERLGHVREAAARARAVVVLKGDDTLVCDPDGVVAVSAGGTPALATAGTGDVLTGVIAALIAQGLDAFAAAAVGVRLHARAGALAARRLGTPEGVIAGDVVAALPAARMPLDQEPGDG